MSSRKSRRSTSDPARTQAIVDFLSLGFRDYLGARVMLNSNLPLQGAILASTAVEKHLKALLSIRGEISRDHLKRAHFNSVKNFAPELYQMLNPTFLEFLQRAYSLRYLDQLKPGFNLNIGAVMTLAEVDTTVFAIRNTVRLRRDGVSVPTTFEAALRANDNRLVVNNHVILGIQKDIFLQREEHWYGVRMRREGLLEVEFVTASSRLDGNFLTEALRLVTATERQAPPPS